MRSLETILVLTLGVLLGGFCLSSVILHLRVLRDMAAQGKPLDREELVQVLLWALLTVVIAGALGAVFLGDLLAGRS